MLRSWIVRGAPAALAYTGLVLAWGYALDKPWPLVAVWSLYDATTLGVPVVLLAVCIYRVRKQRSVRLLIAAAVLLFGLRIYATHIEPQSLRIRKVTLVSDKVTRPLRIAHISDIQSAEFGAYEARVFERLAALQPDIVIHTGDILQTQDLSRVPSELDKLERMLDQVRAPLGRFHVTGDTDWRIEDHYETFRGFQTLDNRGIELVHGADRIRLYGVFVRRARQPQRAARDIAVWRAQDPHAFNIVFAHPPDYILGLENEPVDLCLAGHTHGGQIRIPFFGPPVTATEVPRDLARGFHRVGQTYLNTSAGIGAEHALGLPSIRFNCPPELTLITVMPGPKTSSPTNGL